MQTARLLLSYHEQLTTHSVVMETTRHSAATSRLKMAAQYYCESAIIDCTDVLIYLLVGKRSPDELLRADLLVNYYRVFYVRLRVNVNS